MGEEVSGAQRQPGGSTAVSRWQGSPSSVSAVWGPPPPSGLFSVYALQCVGVSKFKAPGPVTPPCKPPPVTLDPVPRCGACGQVQQRSPHPGLTPLPCPPAPPRRISWACPCSAWSSCSRRRRCGGSSRLPSSCSARWGQGHKRCSWRLPSLTWRSQPLGGAWGRRWKVLLGRKP